MTGLQDITKHLVYSSFCYYYINIQSLNTHEKATYQQPMHNSSHVLGSLMCSSNHFKPKD